MTKKEDDSLRLIVADNIMDFAKKVDKNLQLIRGVDYSYIVEMKLSRFSNSEGRADCLESVRGKDGYFMSDVNNYEITYDMFGEQHRMSYDDHFQDVKRMISATIGTLEKSHVVLPLLYQSRQHKREGRQSLDVNIALRELEFHGANGIITFDAHDPYVAGSSLGPKTSFDNLYPTVDMLKQFVENEDIDMNKLIVINPDEGAGKRANFFAKMLGAETGGFKKERDRTVIADGKSPITRHYYDGIAPIENQNAIIVDDMISSGGSIINTAKELRQKGANKIYLFTTFALFSDGEKSIKKFEDAYENKYFDKLYTTNLSYIPQKVLDSEWIETVDCSMQLARVIDAQNRNKAISHYINGDEDEFKKVLTLKKKGL